MDSFSSNNSPDLELARSIEEANQQGTLISESTDAIASDLLKYRLIKKSKINVSTSNKEQIWNQIDQAISQEKPTRIFSLISSTTKIWAAAAVLILGAALGILYYQKLNTPTLLAQSNAVIETVTLTDGTKVTLRPHSKLYSQSVTDAKQTYSLDGEAFFDVTKNVNRTFSVETDKGMVSVLGTRFNVNSRDNAMHVFLEQGKVQVQSMQSDSILILNPGEAASISESAYPTKDIATAEETLDWLNEELIFNEKSVREITNEIAHHFDIQINVSSDIANLTLSGQLSLADINATLTDLGIVLDGEFVETMPNNYSFNSNN